jgi:hypothetical protein
LAEKIPGSEKAKNEQEKPSITAHFDILRLLPLNLNVKEIPEGRGQDPLAPKRENLRVSGLFDL